MAEEYTLHYWAIKARSWAPLIVASVGGVKLVWNHQVKWPEYKPEAPFGQLPVLTGPNGFKMGQSLAIIRFLARKGGLQGSNDHEFAMSEQLIQEGEDIYGLLAKAQYAPNRTEAMDAVFSTSLTPHLDALSKLLKGQTFTGHLLAGDLAIFAIFDIVHSLDKHFLDKHANLKAFYEHVGANEKVKAVTTVGGAEYFKRHSD